MAARLDLSDEVGFTARMVFSDTHVKCQLTGLLGMEEFLKHMARQRRVGANGNCTG